MHRRKGHASKKYVESGKSVPYFALFPSEVGNHLPQAGEMGKWEIVGHE